MGMSNRPYFLYQVEKHQLYWIGVVRETLCLFALHIACHMSHKHTQTLKSLLSQPGRSPPHESAAVSPGSNVRMRAMGLYSVRCSYLSSRLWGGRCGDIWYPCGSHRSDEKLICDFMLTR